MKVTRSIRDVYEEGIASVTELARFTDDILRPIGVRHKWHYESRVKSLDSFALKIESGRISDPPRLEDWFAAMLVVPNKSNIRTAVDLLSGDEVRLIVESRRPPDEAATTKPPDSFRFDDLRLYVRHSQPSGLPPRPFLDRQFEIQIKTFLQYAWGIATHDKIYKADRLSWGAERIAFQTKATLEHVEASIANLDALELASPAPNFAAYSRRNEFVDFIKGQWEVDRLPPI
jgi:hypothetical protein